MYNNAFDELKRLNFEDLLWITLGITSFLNVLGDYNVKEYLKTYNNTYKSTSNKIFEFTLIVTLIIYIYFLYRNYKAYQSVPNYQKNIYLVRVWGSIFLIVGNLLLIYFQENAKLFDNLKINDF